MNEKKICYICGGRSFFSANLSRKIYEVLSAFRAVMDTEIICGGDFTGKVPGGSSGGGTAGRSRKGSRIRDFVINTGSELRDLVNDRRVFRKLNAMSSVGIVIERSARFCWAGLRYARQNRIPYVLEWKDHLLDYRCSLFKWMARRVEAQKIREADFILIESQVLKDQLIKEGCSEDKILVAYNAVDPVAFVKDPEARTAMRRKFGFAESDLVVGYCGSYAFYHDSMRMILAAEELLKRGLNQVKWLLVGSGRDYEECRRMAAEKGLLDKQVFMVPRVPKEEVPQYLSAFDFAILPGSTDIICPIKVMEYMAAETVVLLPDYDCNREVVTPDSGILFEPFSEKSIADGIEKIANDPARISQMGRAARERVCEHFTWDKTYGAVLKQILERIKAK